MIADMRVLVCGGREYKDRNFLFAVLDSFHMARPITAIIHGNARGADSLAGQWAHYQNPPVPVEVYPADWSTHGKAAGSIRNQFMLDNGKPVCIIAFPGGSGTADMVRRSRKANLTTVVY